MIIDVRNNLKKIRRGTDKSLMYKKEIEEKVAKAMEYLKLESSLRKLAFKGK